MQVFSTKLNTYSLDKSTRFVYLLLEGWKPKMKFSITKFWCFVIRKKLGTKCVSKTSKTKIWHRNQNFVFKETQFVVVGIKLANLPNKVFKKSLKIYYIYANNNFKLCEIYVFNEGTKIKLFVVVDVPNCGIKVVGHMMSAE